MSRGSGWDPAGGRPDVALALQQLDLLSPFQLYFNPHLVFRKFQVRSPRPCSLWAQPGPPRA